LKKYSPSGNLKFINLGILKSLKLRILLEKVLPNSLKLNFSSNTLGGNGLNTAKSTLKLRFNLNYRYPHCVQKTFSGVVNKRGIYVIKCLDPKGGSNAEEDVVSQNV